MRRAPRAVFVVHLTRSLGWGLLVLSSRKSDDAKFNAFHDNSAAALIRDGQLIAAAQEERFRRIKNF